MNTHLSGINFRLYAAALVAATGLAAGLADAQCFLTRLTALSPANGGMFGNALAARGVDLLIGEPSSAIGGSATSRVGRVQFSIRTDTGYSQSYNQKQEFGPSSPEGNSNFGGSVAVDFSYAAAGSYNHTAYGMSGVGMVDVYRWNTVGWVFDQAVFPPAVDAAPQLQFGKSVAVSGNRLIIGANQYNSRGVVYVYGRDAGGTWRLQQRLYPSFLSLFANFGSSVAIDGNFLIVGAPLQNAGHSFSGEAFIYRFNGVEWVLSSGIVGNTANAYMGTCVATSEQRFAAGGSGNHQVVVSQFINGGFGNVLDTIVPSSAAQAVHSIALNDDGKRLAVGNYDPNGHNASVAIYVQDTDGMFYHYDDAFSPSGSGSFGGSVGMHGSLTLVGADDEAAGASVTGGAVYVLPIRTPYAEDCVNALEQSSLDNFVCTIGMAPTPGVQACGMSDSSADAWYKFNPPCAGSYYISTEGSNFDTVLSVYDSCGPDANLIICNDDESSSVRWSRVNINVTNPVYVRVAGYNGVEGYARVVTEFAGYSNEYAVPANPVTEGTTRFCNNGAISNEPNDTIACLASSSASGGSDLWYSYTAGCNSQLTASTCGSTFDTILQLFDHVPTSNSEAIACNDDFCGVQSSITADVRAGQTYLIRISGYQSAQGTGQLNISTTVSCPADFNVDGGVDGADVSAFFAAWESGSSTADVNCDGGTDGSDITVFFAAWEAGGC